MLSFVRPRFISLVTAQDVKGQRSWVMYRTDLILCVSVSAWIFLNSPAASIINGDHSCSTTSLCWRLMLTFNSLPRELDVLYIIALCVCVCVISPVCKDDAFQSLKICSSTFIIWEPYYFPSLTCRRCYKHSFSALFHNVSAQLNMIHHYGYI